MSGPAVAEITQAHRAARQEALQRKLKHCRENIRPASPAIEGELVRMVGVTLEAKGCIAPVGSLCLIQSPQGDAIEAEVVGFGEGKLFLMALGDITGVTPGSRVVPLKRSGQVAVGDELLGRVIDGAGKPLDGRGVIRTTGYLPLNGEQKNPLDRAPIVDPLDVGVRGINGLLTVGRGQRVGLFAGSGVGKSTLLGVMTRATAADVVVVGLIGERGREVKEFIDDTLGQEGLAKAVVVATPADSSPLMRLHGAFRATAIAEYFRDRGKNVLLLMDSLTRFAQAQREIALSIGEFPVSKGYPPSVFTQLPMLVERAGNYNGGSVTAFYTVLVEGDDPNEPIADAARAILDGHIMLSRQVAEQGVYPAIAIDSSISRSMLNIVEPDHDQTARQLRQLYSIYQENRDLISVGAYRGGTDPKIDQAIQFYPLIQDYLRQGVHEKAGLVESVDKLKAMMAMLEAPALGASSGPL